MGQHHYLGALPKISETLLYVAVWRDQWVALLSFSAAALKCSARDRFIGWDFRFQYSRLKLITNNSRFLILAQWHRPNLGSRVLSLCERRLTEDWQKTFGHPVLLLETFLDPLRFRGTVYKAANWRYVGETRDFSRTMRGYQAIYDWADSLGQKARERFGCCRHKGKNIVPSLYIIRDVLIRVDPVHLDRAINQWNQCYGEQDETLGLGIK